MMSYRNCILLLFAFTLFPSCLYQNTTSREGGKNGYPVRKQSDENPLQLLLEHLRLTDRDLAIEAKAADRDFYLLNKAGFFLSNPLTIPSYADHLTRCLDNQKISLQDLLATAVRELEIDCNDTPVPQTAPAPALNREEVLPGISPEAHTAIMELVSVIIASREKMNEAFSPLPQNDIYFLRNYFAEMLLLDKRMLTKENSDRSTPQPQAPLKSDQHYAKEMSFFLPTRIRREDFYQAACSLAAAIDRLLEHGHVLQTIRGKSTWMDSGALRGDIIACEETPWGTIIIGGNGPSYYSGINPLLIIDLGGDDEYHNIASPPTFAPFTAPVSIIIDFKGNDLYRSTKKYAQGSGAFGCSFLIDGSGDDTYLSADFSQGCGFFGVGVLYDRKGNDRYRSDTMAQGAGAFGIGILCDLEGNDSYYGSLYNQGLGFTGGMGLLIDLQGDDTFFAGGTCPDSREPEGAFVSFSQGCGLGDRNYASGGLGILWNGHGNDYYSGSYFAQGAGYWLGTGLLIDRAGNESYQARRYAQGAGTHWAVGALVDESGDDYYSSWGASQGCGYDFSQGLLSDSGGNDSYRATWCAQGAGGKSGVGVLIDRRGNDSYRSGSFCSQGNAQYWSEEEAGSIGLVLDLQGQDEYSGKGKNNLLWRQGYQGGGIDTSGILREADPPPWPEMRALHPRMQVSPPRNPPLIGQREPLPELECDLDYEDQRQMAIEQLSKRGATIIPQLLGYLMIKDAQLTFTVREIIRKMGTSTAPALRKELKEFTQDPSLTASILMMLGDLEDADSLEIFVSFLKADEAILRTTAMRGISKIKHVLPPAILLPSAEDENPAVRKFCASALSTSTDISAIKALTRLLADDHFSVRFAACASLQDKRKEAGPYLLDLIEHPGVYPGCALALARDVVEGRNGPGE